MRQAIVTKWLPPTNTKGSRIKATCDAGSVTVSWDFEKNAPDNHAAAAMALARKLGWSGDWVGGAPPSPSRGYVFVHSAGGSFGELFEV